MMYHLSSLLQGTQIIFPEAKPNLFYKEYWLKQLLDDRLRFCALYALGDITREIEDELGWKKSKLFCECIFELCRKNTDQEHLYPRMRSMYLSASIEEIECFKKHSNRTGTIFEVNVNIEQCQKYDMNLFTKAEDYLSRHTYLTEDVFNYCYQIACDYWKGNVSEDPMMEYLYHGKVEIKPLVID